MSEVIERAIPVLFDNSETKLTETENSTNFPFTVLHNTIVWNANCIPDNDKAAFSIMTELPETTQQMFFTGTYHP